MIKDELGHVMASTVDSVQYPIGKFNWTMPKASNPNESDILPLKLSNVSELYNFWLQV